LTPHVAILLATRNGARHLGDQLDSYVDQTVKQWSLHTSDDGSTDDTVGIIERFARSHPQVKPARQGPQQGYVRNFLSLAEDKSIVADYFAFSDQDDIWYSDKLERALTLLARVPPSVPALYFSRTEVVDEHLNHLGFSPLFIKPPTFQNALVQNIGGGNTMVFNLATKRLLELRAQGGVASHDWWTYQVVTAMGGVAIYDQRPSLKYRQHAGNVLGTNQGARARVRRVFMLFDSKFKDWNDINIAALTRLPVEFQKDSRTTLELFMDSRSAKSLTTRLLRLRQSGVYRQTLFSNVALIVACAFRKI
jgi:glycosyltransferase involved in cell wall biosynthesis